MGQFLKLRLLLSAILTQNLLLQPLVRLQREQERESGTSTANLPWHRCILSMNYLSSSITSFSVRLSYLTLLCSPVKYSCFCTEIWHYFSWINISLINRYQFLCLEGIMCLSWQSVLKEEFTQKWTYSLALHHLFINECSAGNGCRLNQSPTSWLARNNYLNWKCLDLCVSY